MRAGQVRQALEPPVAEHLQGAPHHRAGGRAAHLVADLVHFGQKTNIRGGVDPRERPSAVAAATVRHAPRRAVLADQPAHLGTGQPRRLTKVFAHRPLADSPEPGVPDPHQRAPDELVDPVPVFWAVVHRIAAFQKSIDLIDRAEAFRL